MLEFVEFSDSLDMYAFSCFIIAQLCTEPCYTPNTRRVNYEGRNIGDNLSDQCLEGYEFVAGDLNRTCSSNHTWTGYPAICTGIHTSKPSNLPNIFGKIPKLSLATINTHKR